MLAMLALACGCGTTNWSDTARTATEQLLITDAMDRAISQIDFEILAGKEVFFDPTYLKGTTDENYLVSSLRQHLMASGVVLKDKKEEAMYIVEARVGANGTDRHSLLFGVPAVNLPMTAFPGMPVGTPSALPEIALAKDTNQKAVSKVAVFAYNRVTGMPVWQSGVASARSDANAKWVLGAGPFQKGTIYDGTKFAGGQLDIPLVTGPDQQGPTHENIPVTAEAIFPESVPILAEKEVHRDQASNDAPGEGAATTASATAPAAAPPPPANAVPAMPSPAAPVAAAPAATVPASATMSNANSPAQVTRLPSVPPPTPGNPVQFPNRALPPPGQPILR
ncbi:MAG: hypothetical protein KF708_21175 [Pirellulales bacterium]|nr:hypothetical protein [Pirellulales bacterium]